MTFMEALDYNVGKCSRNDITTVDSHYLDLAYLE